MIYRVLYFDNNGSIIFPYIEVFGTVYIDTFLEKEMMSMR